jgi:hypothetical protein
MSSTRIPITTPIYASRTVVEFGHQALKNLPKNAFVNLPISLTEADAAGQGFVQRNRPAIPLSAHILLKDRLFLI